MPLPPDAALQEAVRTVLLEVFGDRATQTIQSYLDPVMALNQPDQFVEALRRLVGPSIAAVERRIVVRFYELVGLPLPQSPGMTFRDYLADVRRRYIRRLLGSGPGWG